MKCSLSFWLQMSEPITRMDTDNCVTVQDVIIARM